MKGHLNGLLQPAKNMSEGTAGTESQLFWVSFERQSVVFGKNQFEKLFGLFNLN